MKNRLKKIKKGADLIISFKLPIYFRSVLARKVSHVLFSVIQSIASLGSQPFIEALLFKIQL